MYKTYSSINQENKIKNQTSQVNKDSKLYKACQDFESIFIKQMLNVMRKTVNKSGLIDGGFAEEVFEDMLYDEYAQKMSQNANFGLSDSLYKQLSRYPDSTSIV
ncbi:MAG: rod-binding protein [Spirochaetales bacterium]|nr:rod-binding protein [Spirochaetales bacterium]